MGLVEVEEAIQRRKQELEMYEARLKEWGRREGVCVCVYVYGCVCVCVCMRREGCLCVCVCLWVCARAYVRLWVVREGVWEGGKGPHQHWMEGWVERWVGGRLVAPTLGGVYMVVGLGGSRWVCLGYVRERESKRE